MGGQVPMITRDSLWKNFLSLPVLDMGQEVKKNIYKWPQMAKKKKNDRVYNPPLTLSKMEQKCFLPLVLL